MTKMRQQDVEEIARQISARYGSFNVSNLVNYGQTVVVKPGATTDAGRPIRGLEVAEALSGAFAVQPLAVSYGSTAPFSSEEDPTVFERAMNMELDAADAELSESVSPGGDQFGFDSFSPDDPLVVPPVTVRLRTRYQRISSRFGRFAVFALRTGSAIHRQAAARVFNRIKSLWARMLSRSVPVMGLMSPDTLRRRVYEVAQVAPSATAAPAPSTAPVFPLNAPMVSQAPGMPKPLAFDQAALERSVGLSATNQLLAQTFGGTPSLSADTRAETVGYLFSRMEHDYFGLVSTPFQIVLADEDEAVLDEEEDLEALERETESAEGQAEDAPAERKKISEGLPDDDADIEAATEEELVEDPFKSIPDDDSDLEDLDVDEQGLAVADEDLEDDADLLDDDDDMIEGDSFGKASNFSPYVYGKAHKRFREAISSGRLEAAKSDWKKLKAQFDGMSKDEKKKARNDKGFKTLDVILYDAGKINLSLTMQATGLTSEQICGTTKKTKKKISGEFGADGLPDDDSDIDVMLGSDDDLLDEDFGDDDDLPDDDDDLLEDDEPAKPAKPTASAPASAAGPQKASESEDGVSKAVDAAVSAVADASSLASTVKSMAQLPAPAGEPIATSPEHAKRLAQARAKVNAFLSKLQEDAGSAEARGDQSAAAVLKTKIVSLRDRLMELDKAIRGSSASGSINYSSLVPASASTKDKIVVIAVRKSPTSPPAEQAVVKRYAESRGVSSDGHIADVFGADVLTGGGRLQVSGSLAASQTGTMSAERAMNVFGAYLWGVDEEIKRVSAFGGLAASAASLKRYQQMSAQYDAAKAADDQTRAAALLGRMKALYVDLLGEDRVKVVDPFTLKVPGVEIAKMADPKAAAASANVDSHLRMQA